jgi:hypothetical protein
LIGLRAVTVEDMQHNPDGTMKPVVQTELGVSVPPVRQVAPDARMLASSSSSVVVAMTQGRLIIAMDSRKGDVGRAQARLLLSPKLAFIHPN